MGTSNFRSRLLYFFTLSTILLVGVFFYLYMVALPGFGFWYRLTDGQIYRLEKGHPAASVLRTGDRVTAINGVSLEQIGKPPYPSLLASITGLNTLTIQLTRNSQTEAVVVNLQPASLASLLYQVSQFLPSIAFLLYSIVVLLFLRPKDTRWVLFITCYNLTAIWLAATVVQPYNLMYSAIIARLAFLLSTAANLHFCWHFPLQLGPLPRWTAPAGYILAASMGIVASIYSLPVIFYILLITVVVFGCMLLILLHIPAYPSHRREIWLVFLLFMFMFLPWLTQAILADSPSTAVSTSLMAFALPVAPVAILYSVFRHQLGGLELRINRGITVLLYAMLLFAFAFITIAVENWLSPAVNAQPFITTFLVVLVGISSALTYPHFYRWTQQTMLGVPHLPDKLAQSFSYRIATSLEVNRLAQLFIQDVFPSLLVRQAAVLRLDADLRSEPLILFNVAKAMLPGPPEMQALLQSAGKYLPLEKSRKDSPSMMWVRLALIMQIDRQPVGVCLFGRKDPDDFYAMEEIPALQSIINQTALALLNIDQAERLHHYHQASIERHEAERLALARELHDVVLNQLALLSMNLPSSEKTRSFLQSFQAATDQIRSIVSELRPVMIQYGLRHALLELIDGLREKSHIQAHIEMDFPPGDLRFDPNLEMQLYRIAQQACMNAIHHSQATAITISGKLTTGLIQLCIEDNGVGFEIAEHPDLSSLLRNRQFGLAGMYERAELIGADLRIISAPGQGTRVVVNWQASEKLPLKL